MDDKSIYEELTDKGVSRRDFLKDQRYGGRSHRVEFTARGRSQRNQDQKTSRLHDSFNGCQSIGKQTPLADNLAGVAGLRWLQRSAHAKSIANAGEPGAQPDYR